MNDFEQCDSFQKNFLLPHNPHAIVSFFCELDVYYC